ncbi:STAS domain-containing protein [Haloechinothrix sp. YIM 98757]|uniref:STAS domain-containing protein n=1 Tax=Haloechinothrix aidingensis TaxID=2752311 RepID=A0A838AF32_9PSEU|nr:STAS domain-containing protein [Haloechinothrix aidingensis]MBA0127767.1 STAS domain-containing protein [Haloechinothrix aidingensis]
MRPDTIDLSLDHPTQDVAVVTAAGVVDAATVGRLDELLAPRLSCAVSMVVLDVSRVHFLGITAVQSILAASRRMRARGGRFCLVGHPHCVERALRAANFAGQVERYSTVDEALDSHTGMLAGR